MERQGRPRRRPEAPSAPTTLTEITRRYYATALALSKAMGLPLTETFMREHRESISCCFIEAGRAGVRLPAAVQLPPLAQASGLVPIGTIAVPASPALPFQAESNDGTSHPVSPDPPEAGEIVCGMPAGPPVKPTTNGHAPPVAIPADAGLPCGGQLISDLKPPALMMLVSKTATLVHAEGERWVPLLGALQTERARRLERGRKPRGEG